MGFQLNLGRSRSKGTGEPRSLVGKVVLTLFLSIFVIIGGFVSTIILGDAQSGIDQQGWVERPCTIVSSEVAVTASDEDPYEPRITYTYTHGGRDYRGSTVTLSDPATRDYRDAQAIVLANPAGSTGKVFVNPDEPSEAALKTDGLSSLGSIAFLIVWLSIFSGVPLCIIVATWWPRRGGKEGGKAASKAHEARRRGQHAKGGTVVGVAFGGVFAAVGLGMLIFLTILPLYRTVTAQSWDELACDIERSETLSYSDSDGTTYRIDILYFYEVGGQRYGSNRYSFSQIGSSSGRSGKAAITGRYPVGKPARCYVNPSDPTQAVLHRGLSWSNLWGLFPIPFLAVGLFVMYASATGRFQQGGRREGTKQDRSGLTMLNTTGQGMPEPRDDGSPVVLRPGKSRLGAFVGLTLFALIWNGIVSIFVYQMLGDLMRGRPDYCGIAFMVPFVLVGLGVIGFAIRQLMLVFAPRVVVELDRRSLPLGGATKLRWHVEGGRGRFEQVTIKLVGEERATYRRGTDTVTDTHAFYEQVLVGEDNADQQDDNATDLSAYSTPANLGDALLAIPQDSMHSFEANNNQIAWKLVVSARVARWPDPKDTYDLTVLPIPTGAG